ncbi:hypothetical protein PESHB5_07530 [Pediococcus parvulus]
MYFVKEKNVIKTALYTEYKFTESIIQKWSAPTMLNHQVFTALKHKTVFQQAQKYLEQNYNLDQTILIRDSG